MTAAQRRRWYRARNAVSALFGWWVLVFLSFGCVALYHLAGG